MTGVTLHATCIVLGERGVLLRGPSGAGKSSLAEDLIRRWTAAGRFARLVADDRVCVENRNGRLIARAHSALAGLIERRGHGIVPVAFEPRCVVTIAVDLESELPERMPHEHALHTEIEGAVLARLHSATDLFAIGRLACFLAEC